MNADLKADCGLGAGVESGLGHRGVPSGYLVGEHDPQFVVAAGDVFFT